MASRGIYNSITAAGRQRSGVRYVSPPEPVSAPDNFRAYSGIMPWRGTAGDAASGAATRLGGGGSGLLGMLQARAKEQLALGGQLNEEEIRAATQGGRAAAQARGMTRSPQGSLMEILSRAGAANARRREREGFASGVAELEQRERGLDAEIFDTTSRGGLAAMALPESIRQFDTERADSRATDQNNWNWTAYSGGKAESAGKKAGAQSAAGAIAGALAYAFL